MYFWDNDYKGVYYFQNLHSFTRNDHTFQDQIWKVVITLLDKIIEKIFLITPSIYLLCFICSLPLSPIIFHLSCWHHPLYLKIPRELILSQRFFAILFDLQIKLQHFEYGMCKISDWNSLISYTSARCCFFYHI